MNLPLARIELITSVGGEDVGNRLCYELILIQLAISVQKCTGQQDQFSKPAKKEKVYAIRRFHLLMEFT